MFIKVTGIPEGEDATVVFELENGYNPPITLDSDLNVVARITSTTYQRPKITVTQGSNTITKVYSLKGVTLA